MPDGSRISRVRRCTRCRGSDVQFPSRTATKCTGCTNLLDAARSQRMAILRPVPIAVEPEREPDLSENEPHLEWIRQQPCCIHGLACKSARRDPHHVRRVSNGAGTGIKPGDEWCVPLCRSGHMEHDLIGQKTFETKYGVDLYTLAIRLAERSPHIKRERNQ